jgi:hypothetical protein
MIALYPDQTEVVGTRIFWEDYMTEWDRIARIPMKAAWEIMRADDKAWEDNNCVIKEIPNELKIVNKHYNDVYLQCVVDEAAEPPQVKLFAVPSVLRAITQNWDYGWGRVWVKDRRSPQGKGKGEKGRNQKPESRRGH